MTNKHYQSAHLLAFDGKKSFLLIKRKDIPVWVIPGGTRERSETAAETAAREFFEETGIQVPSDQIKLRAIYTPVGRTNKAKLLFTYHFEKTPEPKLTSESQDFGFFTLQRLPAPLSLYEKRKLLDATTTSFNFIERPDTVSVSEEILYLLPHLLTKNILPAFIWQKLKRCCRK